MASDNYKAVGGGIAAVVNADWARNSAPRKAVDWLPRKDVAVLDSAGRYTDQWYRFFAEIARRVGGIQGPSITAVSDSVVQVQSEVLQAQQTATAASAAAAAVDARVDVVKEVAIGAGLPGSGSIP